MQTLLISPFSPYPLHFGGAIRVYHVMKMFAAFSDVTLINYGSGEHDERTEQQLRTICKELHVVKGPPGEADKKWQLQARATFGPRTFQYHSFYSGEMQRTINQVLRSRKFDYIVLEQSQLGYFDVRQPGAIHILDLQNIEYELLERRARAQQNPTKAIALVIEAVKFRRDEQRIYRDVDLIFTPSDRERDTLRQLPGVRRVETLPNSIDSNFFALRSEEPSTNEIVFIGTTHVDANRDGVNYFVKEIFPLIELQIPDVKLWIVGGSPPPEIKAYDERPNISVTGFVEDVRTYMQKARVMVVPLRSGGGTRLKILEGLSFGIPTVSTSVGAEGIELTDNHDILLADDVQGFADAVVRLLRDAELRRKLSFNGRQLVEQCYSWQTVGRNLNTYLHQASSLEPAI